MRKCLPILLLLLTACGGSGKNPKPEDPLADLTPAWTSVTYTKDGARVEIDPPFLVTQQIFADAATGSCTGSNIEVKFYGSYNPNLISRLELSGLTATLQLSGSTFSFEYCLPQGAASVTITAYDKNNKAVRAPLTLSVNAGTPLKTFGYGHPRYPATGFATAAAASRVTSPASGGLTMANASMGGVAGKTTASTGNSGYTLETGFADYLRQAVP
jgi:hypothetical protein